MEQTKATETAVGAARPISVDARIDMALFAGALVCYLCSIYPGVGGSMSPGDAAKFQYIGGALGIPHAPGFPLYVVLSWAWSHIVPCTSMALAQNMLPAILAAAALVVFRRGVREMGVAKVASILAAVTLGLSLRFWQCATEAGPGAMGFAWCAAMLWALLRGAKRRSRRALMVALAFALAAAGHDPMFLFIAVAVLALVLVVDPRSLVGVAGLCACAAGIVGAVLPHVFEYVRARHGAPVMEYLSAQPSVLDVAMYALGAQFWPNWWYASPRDVLAIRVPFVVTESMRQLHIAGGMLGAFGIVALAMRSRRCLLALLAVALASMVPVIHVFSRDVAGLFWPVYMVAAYFCAVGLDLVCAAAGRWWPAMVMAYCAAIILFVAVNQRYLFGRADRFDIEDLLLAVPAESVWFMDDPYVGQEVLRYFEWTNPFVQRRRIVATDDSAVAAGRPTFFFDGRIGAELASNRVPFFAVCSNDHAVLYLVGEQRKQ